MYIKMISFHQEEANNMNGAKFLKPSPMSLFKTIKIKASQADMLRWVTKSWGELHVYRLMNFMEKAILRNDLIEWSITSNSHCNKSSNGHQNLLLINAILLMKPQATGRAM